ncbi:hypothetical protein ACH5RR_026073 [Cinchona calisaya]|uniref:Uncharacterized protein n=1 Tax=Cinchona calisaya TaxID=153742 RepID=A0ABD2Z3E5_9GENT
MVHPQTWVSFSGTSVPVATISTSWRSNRKKTQSTCGGEERDKTPLSQLASLGSLGASSPRVIPAPNIFACQERIYPGMEYLSHQVDDSTFRSRVENEASEGMEENKDIKDDYMPIEEVYKNEFVTPIGVPMETKFA